LWVDVKEVVREPHRLIRVSPNYEQVMNSTRATWVIAWLSC